MKKKITRRTAARLARASYEYEYLAKSMRAEGHTEHAEWLNGIASDLGNLGRSLTEHFEAAYYPYYDEPAKYGL